MAFHSGDTLSKDNSPRHAPGKPRRGTAPRARRQNPQNDDAHDKTSDKTSDKTKGATPSDKAYNFILDMILSRQWAVKSKIMTEPELCRHLNVSRVAVREAVERLSGMGLLEKRQGAGTFVTEPHIDATFRSIFPMIMTNEQDIRQIMEFRRYFEYGNVLLFMKYAGPEDLEALEANYRDMVQQHAAEPEKSWMLDYEFHRLIARGTRNRFIINTADILLEIMRSHQAVVCYFTATHGNATVYHNEILRAMKNGDGEVAAMLMRRHIDIAIECFDKKWLVAEMNRNNGELEPVRVGIVR